MSFLFEDINEGKYLVYFDIYKREPLVKNVIFSSEAKKYHVVKKIDVFRFANCNRQILAECNIIGESTFSVS